MHVPCAHRLFLHRPGGSCAASMYSSAAWRIFRRILGKSKAWQSSLKNTYSSCALLAPH